MVFFISQAEKTENNRILPFAQKQGMPNLLQVEYRFFGLIHQLIHRKWG